MFLSATEVATHMGGVSWNDELVDIVLEFLESPPTWVVWVEITIGLDTNEIVGVATHMGGVSWNCSHSVYNVSSIVATHMGGVSWNKVYIGLVRVITGSPPLWVAWVELLDTQILLLLLFSRHPNWLRELKYK